MWSLWVKIPSEYWHEPLNVSQKQKAEGEVCEEYDRDVPGYWWLPQPGGQEWPLFCYQNWMACPPAFSILLNISNKRVLSLLFVTHFDVRIWIKLKISREHRNLHPFTFVVPHHSAENFSMRNLRLGGISQPINVNASGIGGAPQSLLLQELEQ